MQKAGLFSAVAVAGLGTAVLPAAGAQAAPVPLCPRVIGVCTWTEPSFEGDLRLLFDEEAVLAPPVRSAVNQDFQTWCFYEKPFFDNQGKMREVNQGETVNDFGFGAHSAKRGQCEYND
ncbi:hypothetical protein ACFV6Z_09640 [Streptomyces sp. NPDC059818]|uniref:hypothetical protein n=1 Tax=Streptomyces sp. NPDC059818 TaxID=3346962 RepID=UPI0036629BEF